MEVNNGAGEQAKRSPPRPLEVLWMFEGQLKVGCPGHVYGMVAMWGERQLSHTSACPDGGVRWRCLSVIYYLIVLYLSMIVSNV